jgi:ligand-binding sensor domain-containing protein/signal transduction histidine kinase
MLAFLMLALCLLQPAFILPVSAQSETIRFETISTDQGLSQSTVNAILQDRQGYLWFATEKGVDQYDGYQFTTYEHDPNDPRSLSDDVVDALFEDSSGSLWIGTNSGLDRLDPSRGALMHYPKDLTGANDLSGIPISAIGLDPLGPLVVGTSGGGLYLIDLSTNHLTQYRHHPEDPQSLSNDTINAIYVSQEGDTWIGTDGGLDRFDAKTGTFDHPLALAANSPIPNSTPIRSIHEDDRRRIWIGTDAGLILWDRAANQIHTYQYDSNDSTSLSDNAVLSILEDSQGVIWIGTLRGLNQYDPTSNRFRRYLHDPNNPNSLSSNYIRSIFEDRSGVVWIGTSFGGLNKYARSTQKFALYKIQPGLTNNLSDNNIWSIYQDQSQNLWIGTFFSGLNKIDPTTGNITVYQNNPADPTSLSDNEIRAILQDRSGILWVGTEHGGLNRYDPDTGTFHQYRYSADDPTSLGSDRVFALYQDHQGTLWVGTEAGGLNRFNSTTGTWTRYEHDAKDPTSLSDNGVRAIYQDHYGELWIGTEEGGLNLWDDRYQPVKVYRYDPQNPTSLSDNWVLSIAEDQQGTLWIGTADGLNRFNRSTQSFTRYTVKDGLPDDTIYGILVDDTGNLWLSTTKGLSRFNPAAGTFRNYDMGDGLQGDQFNPGAFFRAANGDMYFGGSNGFNSFDPNLVKDNPIPPPVVIADVKKYNQTIQSNLTSNESIVLSYRDNFISFDFSALDYNAPAKNQYAYQLVGVDKDWVYAGTRRYASYDNLQGGDYIFRVKASNNDGVWDTTGTAIRIHITPPFWQTWWFIGIVGLVAGAGAFGGYRIRVRDMQSRNRELGKRVEQRTHELAALNTISAVVNRSLDLTEILNNTLEKTMEVMQMDAGLAFGLEKLPEHASEEPYLKLLAYRGVSQAYAKAVGFLPLRSTMVAKAIEAGKPLIHLSNEHPDPQIRAADEREGIRMAISLPLLVKGELVGTVSLATHEPRAITVEELSLLDAIGQQVGMAVFNARLYEQAEQTAITTERSRLARELHDSVTQLLYSVTLYAEAAAELLATGETETAAGHLRELRDTAQEALREMRLLIFELRRPALGQGGLAAALQARLDAVERRGGMQAELIVEGKDQLSRLVQAELYNIAQEALNNALKHARANHVHIRLIFGETVTEMEIGDDGVGFKPNGDHPGGGFGISSMNERSHKIGGTLQIESSPGNGTRLTVRVPHDTNNHSEPGGSGT